MDRTWLIHALAAARSKNALPYLLPLLNDPDPYVRRSAARALGQIGSPEAIEPLLKLAPEPAWEREALHALKAISQRQGIRILLDGTYVKIR